MTVCSAKNSNKYQLTLISSRHFFWIIVPVIIALPLLRFLHKQKTEKIRIK